ncbi:MAG: hypothetical protein SF029_15765 [bacterium]|nr:hypothetical protein [bacterium]
MAFLIAAKGAATWGQAVMWAAVYVVLVCVLPVVYIALMVKLGRITDIHMKVRRQRFLPLVVSICCAGMAWVSMRLLGAPPVLPMFALFSLVQLAVISLITLVWQISIHAISISGATVAAGALFGLQPMLLTVPLVVLVGAARLKLRRHTPAQVVVGTMVGVAISAAMFLLVTVPL